MKKLIALVLTVVFVLTMGVGVFAEENTEKTANPEIQAKREEVQLLVAQLKDTRDEVKNLHVQIKENREIIKPLLKEIKESENTENFEDIKDINEQIKAINQQRKTLKETKEEIRLSIKKAKEIKDIDTIISGLTELLSHKDELMNLINEKIVLQDELLQILQAENI